MMTIILQQNTYKPCEIHKLVTQTSQAGASFCVTFKRMEKSVQNLNRPPESGGTVVDRALTRPSARDDEPAFEHWLHRTPGLKIFDIGLYPILTNFAVFAVSVAATYLTAYGDKTGGKIGRWFFDRGTWFKNHAMRMGMDEKHADGMKMVAFSFLDGSIMAPAIKILEDHREEIAKSIDDTLGTRPADDSVYQAEPKQSWGSVLGGRVVTLSAVLPTAIAMGKLGMKDGKWLWNKTPNNPGFSSMNDMVFTNPGVELGKQIEANPNLAKHFHGLNIPVLMGVSIFEAFYTSLCTAALYVSSRFIASQRNDVVDAQPVAPNAPLARDARFMAPDTTHAHHHAQESLISRVIDAPHTHIDSASASHHQPLAEAKSTHLTNAQ